MLVLEGKSVFAGIAIGPVILYKRMVHTVAGHVVANPESEVARFRAARLTAQNQIKA